MMVRLLLIAALLGACSTSTSPPAESAAGEDVEATEDAATPDDEDTADDAGKKPPKPEVQGCVPACGGKACGSDGCGGSCGACEGPAACVAGACVVAGATCADRLVVEPIPFTGQADTTGAGDEASLTANSCTGAAGAGAGAPDQLWKLVAPEPGLYVITVTADWDAVLSRRAVCAFDGCQAASVAPGGSHTLALEMANHQELTLVVDGLTAGDEGPYTLTVERCVPTCDGAECGDDGCGGSCGTCSEGVSCIDGVCQIPGGCAAPHDVGPLPFEGTGDTTGTGADLALPGAGCPGADATGGGASSDEVWRFVAPAAGDYEVLLVPDFDGTLYVATGCEDVAGTCLGGSAKPGLGVIERVELELTEGETALIVVDGWSDAFDEAGTYALKVSALCDPQCEGKVCGPDGCGNTCGECDGFDVCTGGVCTPCEPDCGGKACGADGCGGTCGECEAPDVCVAGACTPCQPECEDKACGPDGCGGSCGACEGAEICSAGSCICVEQCDGKTCGPDGCGGTCGECDDGEHCVDGACECAPACGDAACGPDGCGGSCGECPPAHACEEGACVPCTPDCAGKFCGPDGCGGSCGACDEGEACAAGYCACVTDCAGKQCGPDGCGGTCGSCPSGQSCDQGTCVSDCTPSCAGKQCGPDGCGGSCGLCSSGYTCNGFGYCMPLSNSCQGYCGNATPAGCFCDSLCANKGDCCPDFCSFCASQSPGFCCEPQCAGKQCGSDGCGGSCGSCGAGKVCNSGTCKPAPSCQYRCGEYLADAPCQCDPQCFSSGDCCADICSWCGSQFPTQCASAGGSCASQGCGYQEGASCQCDNECAQHGDCCADTCFYCSWGFCN